MMDTTKSVLRGGLLIFRGLDSSSNIRVLIICAHRPGRSPSQRYRFEQYLPYLRENGYSFTFSYLLEEEDDRIFYEPGHLVRKARVLWRNIRQRKRDIRRLNRFDLVFIQRESHFLGSIFFEKAVAQKKKRIIFDFDDSIWLSDTSPANRKFAWIKRPSKFFDVIPLATEVIAGNKYLAEKAAALNSRVTVIPTTIDTEIHVPRHDLRSGKKLTIGWSGSASTVKHFEVLLPVLSRLQQEMSGRLEVRLMGATPRYSELPELVTVKWSEQSEVEELNRYDVGIMPLPDEAWSLGKCGLKALSYMACEVPVVASRVGANKEIIRDNYNGFLADTPEDWYHILKMLLEDEALRKIVGKRGRETVEEKYSVLANRQKYVGVFARAMARP